MFTGLIEKAGRLETVIRRGSGYRLRVRHDRWDEPLSPGDSIAVHGVCLTVTDRGADWFACDLLEETAGVTSLSRRPAGSLLNLERALRCGDRFGGHLVTGHVDGIGRISAVGRAGNDRELRIACDSGLLAGIVSKGCVACDGVSLTVSRLEADFFAVRIISFTWTHTGFCAARAGDPVNLEIDLIGKYVRRVLTAGPGTGGVTEARLRAAGFVGH